MSTTSEESNTVTFHFIKGPRFESHKIDGAIADYVPGGISLAFFVERTAIPQSVTHQFEADGSLGKVCSATGKDGIVREIQTGIILDLDEAQDLVDQITGLIAKIKETTNDDISN